ncbi:putative phiE125 gp8 family phage protein [Mesorhizobium sp. USDA 4775]
MNLVLESPPEPLGDLILRQVCDHLRVEFGGSLPTDKAYILSCIGAAVSRLDGKHGRLGRCLLTQEWTLYLDSFPTCIELPLPPLQEVIHVKYLDNDGVLQTLDPSAYRVSGAGSWRPEIAPAYGEKWPHARYIADAVQVRFRAGYGADEESVPPPILQAIKVTAAQYYVERQPVTFTTPHEIPLLACDLIAPFKIYR